MSETRNGSGTDMLFGAVLGGIMASFTGSVLFRLVMEGDLLSPYEPVGPQGLFSQAVAGIACALLFMAAGLFTSQRQGWLRNAFLFASGFTALWSSAMSLSLEPEWVGPSALGLAAVVGAGLGWLRYRRFPHSTSIDGSEAEWIR